MERIILPGLDMTLLEAIQHNVVHNAEHPLFRYDDESGAVKSITWSQAGNAFTVAGHYILDSIKRIDSDTQLLPTTTDVVAILANLDSITFHTLIVGIIKAGLTPFLISTRNPPDAIAHLLASANARVLITTDDPTITTLAAASIKLFQDKERTTIHPILAPSFEQLYVASASTPDDGLPTVVDPDADKWNRTCVITHSSGTTSLPKLVVLTHRMIQQHGVANRYDQDTYVGHTLAAHGIPMFHMMGFCVISWSAMLVLTLSQFQPKRPPIIPGPAAVLKSAIVTKASILYCAPMFIETWALDPSSVQALKSFRSILYGGGPMKDEVGNRLVQEGVKLSPIFGLSETGCITTLAPTHIGPTVGPMWLQADPRIDIVFIPEDEEKLKGVFRIAMKENEYRKPAYCDTTVDGVPAFDTKDLVVFHPDNAKLWKVVGRADDQITHSTGEKTNPTPIESILAKSPYIDAALIFGRAKPQVGVIVKPSAGHVFDIKDNKCFDNYLNMIWEHIAEANLSSPPYSRIFKEMILVMDPDKPFEYTPKMTLRRKITLEKYGRDIEQLYEVTELSTDIAKPASMNYGDVTHFIHSVVCKILDRHLKHDDDIFNAGADSLCAMSIRITITRGLVGLVGRGKADTLPRDLVYLYPTIDAMAVFISNIFLTKGANLLDVASTKLLEDDLQWEGIIKSIEKNQTVVKITQGNASDTPLIIIHGASASVAVFRPFMNARSPVWGLQMTDLVPRDSAEHVCEFYFERIKEQQPQGPYRIASYSGSCVWALEIVRLIESRGEVVKELVFLDHCPAAFFPRFDPTGVRPDDDVWMNDFIRNGVRDVANMLIPTMLHATRLVSNMARIRNFESVMKALTSTTDADVPPHLALYVQCATTMQATSVKYLMKDDFMATDSNGLKVWSSNHFRKFTSHIKAPLTIYVATYGMSASMHPGTDFWKMRDLGASMVFDNYTVVSIPGDHLSFLEEPKLHEHLFI